MTDNIKFTSLLKNCKTEQVLVLTNKDAEIIRLIKNLATNRPSNAKHIKSIVDSIKKGQFLMPIVVKSVTKEVIDGNHRFSAILECLNQEIPFEARFHFINISEDAIDIAIRHNNTQHSWNLNDRLYSYVKQRKEAYVKLHNFMLKYSDYNRNSIRNALVLLAGNRSATSMYKSFKNGTLSIKDSNIDRGTVLISELIQISQALEDSDRRIFCDTSVTGWIDARDIIYTKLNGKFYRYLTALRRKKATWHEPLRGRNNWNQAYLKILNSIK